MWYTLRKSPQTDPDFALVATELLERTSRNIMVAIGGLYLLWCLVAPLIWSSYLIPITLLLTPLVVLITVVSVGLVTSHYVAAQVVWHLGLAAAVAIAIQVFQQPAIGFVFALLPMVGAVAVGWPAAVVVEGLVVAAAWWLCGGSGAPSLPVAYGAAIVAAGAVAGLLGWVSTSALLVVTEWALFSSARARANMEEARQQQQSLKEMQQSLIHANRELERLSDRLKALHQVAEEARRAKEEFVANVSHELRTPLHIIIGFSEMIIQAPHVYGKRLPPALLADVTIIQRSSRHLAKLVDDVLDLSQVEAGRLALSKEWTSLRDIIDEAAEAVRALFESKQLALEIEIQPNLPAVFCDSTRVSQVILNLLSNAGRYADSGRVQIRAWREADSVVVRVTDTGPGIAREDHAKVFEPFQQVDNAIRRHGGRGLGLSISKRFVELHGGRIWLESTPGVGTSISFSLPLEAPLSDVSGQGDWRRWLSLSEPYEARRPRSRLPATRVGPRYVLLEEGDTLSRLFSRYVSGAEIVPVTSPEDALRELARSPARALVVNTPSPDDGHINGADLTSLPYGTPTILCWVPGADEAARRLGVVRYLVKPVARETLLRTLESLGDHIRKLLVVDEDPEVLQLLSRVLASAERRYDVLLATHAERALEMLRRRRPDALVLDLSTPASGGFSLLLEKGRDATIRHTPVIVMSSRDPTGSPIMVDRLTVTRGGGLSVGDLLTCVQSLSEILSPSA